MTKVTGVKEALNKIGRIKAKVSEIAGQGIEAAALTCFTRARQLVPVRTGRLRDSITVQRISTSKIAVEATASYSGFVEYGTRYMKPRPYMRPAAAEALEKLAAELSRVFQT